MRNQLRRISSANTAILLHHFTHQNGTFEAETFWTGLGAIRRSVFEQVDGFSDDPMLLEDVELGLSLRADGFRIALDPEDLRDPSEGLDASRPWSRPIYFVAPFPGLLSSGARQTDDRPEYECKWAAGSGVGLSRHGVLALVSRLARLRLGGDRRHVSALASMRPLLAASSPGTRRALRGTLHPCAFRSSFLCGHRVPDGARSAMSRAASRLADVPVCHDRSKRRFRAWRQRAASRLADDPTAGDRDPNETRRSCAAPVSRWSEHWLRRTPGTRRPR